MSMHNRRHDDYRPASLRNFWRSCQNAIWTVEHACYRWFDVAQLVLFFGLLLFAACLAVYVLRFLLLG